MPSDLMQGYPPRHESLVTLENWQLPPYNRWAFQHMRELVPTHRISPANAVPRELLVADRTDDLLRVPVQRIEKGTTTAGEVIRDTFTDAVLVMHNGEIVLERYLTTTAQTPHLLMSVSKSIVGSIAGILAAQGRLDVSAKAETYVPEVSKSGYGGASVRDILDMRTGVRFREEYTNQQAEVRTIEAFMGWRPQDREISTEGMYAFLAKLEKEGPHGGRFTYRSSDADMLGWICERAAGARMADLISDLLWAPMGAEFDAEVTCDRVGTAVHDGGVCACLRDVARFGQLVLDGGLRGQTSVIPGEWLHQSLKIDPDIRRAFAASDNELFLPGGWYRNQFWFVPGPSGAVQLCLGIHGQMVLVDHETGTVAVKLSTWPDAQNAAFLVDTVRAFTAIGRHLAGLSGTDGVAPPSAASSRTAASPMIKNQ